MACSPVHSTVAVRRKKNYLQNSETSIHVEGKIYTLESIAFSSSSNHHPCFFPKLSCSLTGNVDDDDHHTIIRLTNTMRLSSLNWYQSLTLCDSSSRGRSPPQANIKASRLILGHPRDVTARRVEKMMIDEMNECHSSCNIDYHRYNGNNFRPQLTWIYIFLYHTLNWSFHSFFYRLSMAFLWWWLKMVNFCIYLIMLPNIWAIPWWVKLFSCWITAGIPILCILEILSRKSIQNMILLEINSCPHQNWKDYQGSSSLGCRSILSMISVHRWTQNHSDNSFSCNFTGSAYSKQVD